MKRILTLVAAIATLVVLLFGLIHSARAAKMSVTWIPPTKNSDGSPLTNLSYYRIEWGSCNADGSFNAYQAGINIAAPASSGYIYPTGLSPVCAHVFAINSSGGISVASNTSSAVPPPLLSKPVTR
jgi:hypothetical protein